MLYCSAILFHSVLYCVMLFTFIIWCTMMGYSVLQYSVLYYTILCYTILCCAMPYCTMTCYYIRHYYTKNYSTLHRHSTGTVFQHLLAWTLTMCYCILCLNDIVTSGMMQIIHILHSIAQLIFISPYKDGNIIQYYMNWVILD